MIKGISEDMLRSYVAMREKVDVEAKTIQSLSSMMTILQQCGDDKIEIDPVALGYSQSLIEKSILNIWEMLDDFIYIVQARLEIEQKER